jgi:hypothetical protein
MSRSLQRHLASFAMTLTAALLPRAMRGWADAMRQEMSHIARDRDALAFAGGCLWAAARERFFSPLRRMADAGRSHGSQVMQFVSDLSRHPRSLAVAAACAATLLGLGYMAIAGAPFRMLATNAAALLIGFGVLLALIPVVRSRRVDGGTVSLSLGCVLLATSFFGQSAEGATRWLVVGGLALQPSLILVPVMTVAMARARNPLALAGIVIAALALALQPDRAMAATLATGLAVVALIRPERHILLAHGAAILAFGWTLTQPDALPATPYVDQIVWSSFALHPLAGLGVACGLCLLVLPALAGFVRDPGRREIYAVFGATWLAIIVAAVLDNYPTPLVGYGASAIIGYVLGLIGLPERIEAVEDTRAAASSAGQSEELPLGVRFA